jgi:hypothetical protein
VSGTSGSQKGGQKKGQKRVGQKKVSGQKKGPEKSVRNLFSVNALCHGFAFGRFGRAVRAAWKRHSTGALLDETDYTYDYAGNRLPRDIPTSLYRTDNWDQVYAYNGLHRLATFDVGRQGGSPRNDRAPVSRSFATIAKSLDSFCVTKTELHRRATFTCDAGQLRPHGLLQRHAATEMGLGGTSTYRVQTSAAMQYASCGTPRGHKKR